MNPAAEILVIILSIFLALFLLLGIILTIYLIKLTRDIRGITQSAGKAVSNFESVIANVSKFSSPLLIVKLVGKYIASLRKTK